MNLVIGDKVRINVSEATKYVGRHMAAIGTIRGKDVDGDFLVRTPITSSGRVVGYEAAWIAPEHLRKLK